MVGMGVSNIPVTQGIPPCMMNGGMHGDTPQLQQQSANVEGGDEDDLVITGQSGTFSADLPHARAHCMMKPFKLVRDRVGVESGDGNETFCANCFCYVCDVKASECQGWLPVGHCHANDKDPYWKALREFTRTDMLCNSPLLQVRATSEMRRSVAAFSSKRCSLFIKMLQPFNHSVAAFSSSCDGEEWSCH